MFSVHLTDFLISKDLTSPQLGQFTCQVASLFGGLGKLQQVRYLIDWIKIHHAYLALTGFSFEPLDLHSRVKIFEFQDFFDQQPVAKAFQLNFFEKVTKV